MDKSSSSPNSKLQAAEIEGGVSAEQVQAASQLQDAQQSEAAQPPQAAEQPHDASQAQAAEQPHDAEQPSGLTSAEVQERIARGDVNIETNTNTRTLGQIVRDNVLTLFNAINVILACFVIYTGSYRNALFMIIIICNVAIGIIQELRSKAATDALSIVAGANATVVRDGKREEIALDKLVRDDVIFLGRGDQIPADSVVISGKCDVDESLLTGESKAIHKSAGDELMSGSFINSGTVYARVEHVGAENYAAQISAEAKKHKEINSEIMNSLNGIIRVVSILLTPIGLALFASTVIGEGTGINEAILSTVAALIGMIPEGLILLTSTVLAVAVVRLAQSKVLVQQLYCIETLARVDTLCLDKTGTITTGHMEVERIVAIRDAQAQGSQTEQAQVSQNAQASDTQEAQVAIASICAADEDPNETAMAINNYFSCGQAEEWGEGKAEGQAEALGEKSFASSDGHSSENVSRETFSKIAPLPATRLVPFSSDKKYSGATLEGGKSYVMGAVQYIMGEGYEDKFPNLANQATALAENSRLLLVARVDAFTDDGKIKGSPEPIGFVCIRDQIRPTAAQTIKYFTEQGVTINVISGDDPRTVSGIAQSVGVPNSDKYVDALTLKTQDDIEAAIQKYHVFGRVKPEQKKAFVLALQKFNHVVAMTGDGVNDTLALKQADCSVAMASGSDAAKNVAQLVLVDNDFASMPKVVAEGRRSINNLQRSASLFLVKTLLSMSLAVLFIILPWQYPFQPIQMTLFSAFAIGLPSFVLALEPNKDRITGRFLPNVIVHSIPGAVVDVVGIIVFHILGYTVLDLSYEQVSTVCLLFLAFVGMLLIIRLSIPFTPIRVALLVVVVGGVIIGSTAFGWLFNITALTLPMMCELGIAAGVSAVIFNVFYSKLDTWYSAHKQLR